MLTIRVLSGGRSGLSRSLERGSLTVGRHPDAILSLDPDVDVLASGHHATISGQGNTWVVQDLESRNGTWVNGERIRSKRQLRHGDRIHFGVGGPEAVILLQTSDNATVIQPTTTRPRQARGTRWIWAGSTAVLGAALLLVAGGWARDRSRWETERNALFASVDSALGASARASEALEGRLADLGEALDRSRGEVTSLRDELSQSWPDADDAELGRLQTDLQAATQALRRQQLAATLNFSAIEEANRSAVTLVYAEGPSGQVALATGFAVSPDGVIATNRHVVTGEDGQVLDRLGIQFTDSRQVWPARVVAVSAEADLVLLRVENLLGQVPVIRGLNPRADTVNVVAMIGFPLAAAQASTSGERRIPDPLVSAGVVLSRSATELEIQGYGAQGASGSPVFDGAGNVIGVVYGGRTDRTPPTVLALPVAELNALLAESR